MILIINRTYVLFSLAMKEMCEIYIKFFLLFFNNFQQRKMKKKDPTLTVGSRVTYTEGIPDSIHSGYIQYTYTRYH